MSQSTTDKYLANDDPLLCLEIKQKLLDKTKQFETLMANIQGGVLICKADYDFTITYSNEGFSALTGYTEDDIENILQRKRRILINEKDFTSIADSILYQLETSNRYSIEYLLKCKDGRSVWVIDKGIMSTMQNGEKYIHCILTDLSEQKLQNTMLEQKTFELLTITNNIEAAIIRHDLSDDCSLTYVNDGFYRLIGYTKEEFAREHNDSFSSIIHRDDICETFEKLHNQLKRGITDTNVLRLIRKDGTPVWILAKGSVVETGNGGVEFHGVLTDIDMQKKQEEALLVSEKRYEIAMQYAEVIIFDYIIESNTIVHPDTAAQKYAVPNVLRGGIIQAIEAGGIHPNHVEKAKQMFERIIAGEEHVKENIMLIDIDGKRTINEIHLINIYDKAGKPIRAVGVIKDITQTALLEKEKKYEKAMNSDRRFCYEADISNNTLVIHDVAWANELGLLGASRFTDMIDILKQQCGSFDDETAYAFHFLGIPQKFEEAYENGNKSIVTEFSQQNNLTTSWFEKTINIIKDDMTGDLSVRCYIRNIDSHKERERRAQEEQTYYDAMVAKSITVYEIDITHDVVLSGLEQWDEMFAVQSDGSYTGTIDALCTAIVHPDDQKNFFNVFSRDNVLTQFAFGAREFRCEYRRPYPEKSSGYYWVCTVMHLFEDPNTRDVRGNSYVENIDKQKLDQLELIYKSEHDLLTGLYNKATLESRIDAFLTTGDSRLGRHAFIILDIDYFKQINDNFGHAFGDAVLSQTSKKLAELFREDDIIGRIGGDEFVVLMKNVVNEKIVMLKAEEICKNLREEYNQNGKTYFVSASVGIALFSDDGRDFEQLYQHSDTALYAAKEQGRNCALRYSSDMEGKLATPKPINNSSFLSVKSFHENISDYIFRILYESDDWRSSINAVIELVGKHLGISRAYIFEDSSDSTYTVNTFEWCNKNILPQIDNLQRVSYELIPFFKDSFDEFGIYFIHETSSVPEALRDILIPQQIKSMLCFSITKAGKFVGFVGFDQCGYSRIPSTAELSDLRTIANMLGIFVMQMRASARIEEAHKSSLAIINGLVSRAYVCDPMTHRVLFMNSMLTDLLPNAQVGGLCYEMFWGKEEPCERCPMKEMIKANSPVNMEFYNTKLDMWFRATGSMIDWFDNKQVCLVDSVDITEYKNNMRENFPQST